jgi:predicted ATPase
VQDAAYQSLLKSKRRQLHARIADVLEERFPDRIETEPELFAHHLTEAGLAKRAIGYWEKAGLRAAERSANAEAAAHLAKGLELIGALPATRERAEQELILQAELGAALTPTKGYTAPETKAAYMRAHALCLEVGESAQLFEVLYGIWNYLLVAGELCKARELADEALGLAQRQENKTALLLAHNWSGVTCVALGELTSAHAHLDRALALIDPSQHRSLMHLCGEDPEYESLSWQSWADWFLGYPERALRRSREALAKANELSYSQSTAYAMGFAAMLRLFRREDQAVQEMAEELISLCTDHDIPVFAAMGSAFRGWALTGRGEIDEGIEQIGESVLQLRAMEAAINVPYLVALMAEGCERAGYWEKGLSLLGEALDLMERTEQRVWEPEFNRLRGQLLLSRSMENDVRAEACFRRAIDIARRQSAKSWELRAATSLARVWAEQGERQKANDLLAPVYNWFTEGFDTADLKDAKALLDELS